MFWLVIGLVLTNSEKITIKWPRAPDHIVSVGLADYHPGLKFPSSKMKFEWDLAENEIYIPLHDPQGEFEVRLNWPSNVDRIYLVSCRFQIIFILFQ